MTHAGRGCVQLGRRERLRQWRCSLLLIVMILLRLLLCLLSLGSQAGAKGLLLLHCLLRGLVRHLLGGLSLLCMLQLLQLLQLRCLCLLTRVAGRPIQSQRLR